MTKACSKGGNRFAEAPENTRSYAIEEDSAWEHKKLHDATKAKVSDLKLKAKGKFKYLFDGGVFGSFIRIMVKKPMRLWKVRDYASAVF